MGNKLRIVHLPKHMIEGLGVCFAIEWESLILNCIKRPFLGKKWPGFFDAIVVVTREPLRKTSQGTGYPSRGCSFEWCYPFAAESRF
jgi:hypothetical protein